MEDLHICGACKAQFTEVELFFVHKRQCPARAHICEACGAHFNDVELFFVHKHQCPAALDKTTIRSADRRLQTVTSTENEADAEVSSGEQQTHDAQTDVNLDCQDVRADDNTESLIRQYQGELERDFQPRQVLVGQSREHIHVLTVDDDVVSAENLNTLENVTNAAVQNLQGLQDVTNAAAENLQTFQNQDEAMVSITGPLLTAKQVQNATAVNQMEVNRVNNLFTANQPTAQFSTIHNLLQRGTELNGEAAPSVTAEFLVPHGQQVMQVTSNIHQGSALSQTRLLSSPEKTGIK